MPKIAYEQWNPNRKSQVLLSHALNIIEEFQVDGYTLTLRQLYYQFVGNDLIPNTERSYKNLGNLVTKGRMAGYIDWLAIEDRNRGHVAPWIMEDDEELVSRLQHSINFDRWKRQDNYVEVWVEKEALGNVIAKACDPTDTPYLSCKGYLSASEAWRAGRRLRARRNAGQQPVVIHLGDHDPSGIDMSRDNSERLSIFSEQWLQVERIALNWDQVQQYSPPPNPTKLSDSRAGEYLDIYGHDCWELDALKPSVIEQLIKDKIEEYIDRDVWSEVDEEESEMVELFSKLSDNWDDVKDYTLTL